VPEDDLGSRRLRGAETERLVLNVKMGEALIRVFLEGTPSTAVR
jgi:hypothetical protein